MNKDTTNLLIIAGLAFIAFRMWKQGQFAASAPQQTTVIPGPSGGASDAEASEGGFFGLLEDIAGPVAEGITSALMSEEDSSAESL